MLCCCDGVHTSSSDFAFSRPIDVPRPPFSFSTAVWDSSFCDTRDRSTFGGCGYQLCHSHNHHDVSSRAHQSGKATCHQHLQVDILCSVKFLQPREVVNGLNGVFPDLQRCIVSQ